MFDQVWVLKRPARSCEGVVMKCVSFECAGVGCEVHCQPMIDAASAHPPVHALEVG